MGKNKKKKQQTGRDDHTRDIEDKAPSAPKVKFGTFADIWPKDLKN